MTRNDAVAKQSGHSSTVVQPEYEPSTQWGWHGGFPHGSIIAGWTTAAILAIILISHLLGGHSEGHIADIYLGLMTAGLILQLIRRTVRGRHSWRR